VFCTLFPYRVISFARRWAYDVLALLPLIAAGAWWVTVSTGTNVPSDSVQSADSLQQFLLSHHVSRFYPTLIALLLCVVILRTGRTARIFRSREKVFLIQRMPLGIVAFLAVLAFLDVILVPGPLIDRAGPCVVAALWGWLVRSQVYARAHVLEATGAGFRPPVRVAFRRRLRRRVKPCLSSTWQVLKTYTEAWKGIEASIEYFAAIADTPTLAWCLAREVDLFLSAGGLDAVEIILKVADRYEGVHEQPCWRAARGLFNLALGGEDEAAQAFADAERLIGSGRRVPPRLRTLRLEYPIAQAEGRDGAARADEAKARSWTGWTRARLAWNRQYAVIISDILAGTIPMEKDDPALALRLAECLGQLVDALGQQSAQADLTAQEAVDLQLVKAASAERMGDILARQKRFREASACYVTASNLYQEREYRPRGGFAAARGAALALRGGMAEGDAPMELSLLTALLTGLQAMEYYRGRLLAARHLRQLLVSRSVLYSEVLRSLACHVTRHQDKAAEIALWLLESAHRNHLAEKISVRQAQEPAALGRGGQDAAQEAWRRLHSPADLAKIRRLVTGRAVLSYWCDEASDGWRITTVLAAPSGITIHHALLPAVAPGTGRITAMQEPAGILDRLAEEGERWPGRVHRAVVLSDDTWAAIAGALLPPELPGVLRTLSSGTASPVLVIVPHGPLSGVPFAGLRLPDGSAVIDHAAVVFMPSLIPFSSAGWSGEPDPAGCVLVRHVGPTRFNEAFEELRFHPRYEPARLRIREAPSRAAFLGELTRPTPPSIAVISHHGHRAHSEGASPAETTDGTPSPGSASTGAYIEFVDGVLTERQAREFPWPQTVVLGSCWASDLTVEEEGPVGMPTACLLKGARAVLGGQSFVHDETSARILATVTLEAALGRHPALALRDAIRQHLERHPSDRDALPSQWANLTVWTSRPPIGQSEAVPTWTPWTTALTARGPKTDKFPVFDSELTKPQRREPARYPGIPVNPALRRALQYAAKERGAWDGITTLDLAAAIIVTDSADWTGFTLAADLRALPPRKATGGRASAEASGKTTVIALDPDHQVRVTAATADAMVWAERLAARIEKDPIIAPAHVIYGILCCQDCDAALWMTAGPHDAQALIDLLSDHVFAVDLPSAADLAPAKARPAPIRATDGSGRSLPKISREIIDLIIAARRQDGASGPVTGTVVTTLGILRAMIAVGSRPWRALAAAGFRLAAPGDALLPEGDRGGEEVQISPTLSVMASREFAYAFTTGAALAGHLGDPEVTAAHLLYGFLTDHGSDAARWVRRDPAGANGVPDPDGSVTVLADRVFQCPLPAPTRIPVTPRSRPANGSRTWVPLAPWLLLAAAVRTLKGAWRFAFGVAVLLLIGVTMGLADINTATSNSTQLVADRPVVTGSLSLTGADGGSAVPATLLGPVSDFYTAPAVRGLLNQVRSVFSSNIPGDLSGLYFFTIPAPAHAPSATPGWLNYRGGRYQAQVTCQGQFAQHFCIVVVRLPPATAPSGFSWIQETLSNGATGSVIPQTALVFRAGSRSETVSQAELRILAQDSSGVDILAARTQSGQPMQPGSPVVLSGRSRQLPLLGIAIPSRNGTWDTVFGLDVFTLYAEGIADRIAGSRPGAVPYLGIDYSGGTAPGPTTISDVLIGSPADDAGLQAGDEITAIDGQPVQAPDDLADVIGQYQPGQVIKVTIVRQSGTRRTTLTLPLALGYQ
jgi:hypothetical protein